MAKKNSFGKFLAFTTTVAALGGVCYVFRDQIKESSVYKKSVDKLAALRDKVSDKFASSDDDFFFDDEYGDDFEDDIFTEDAKNNREYTSITINPKEETSDKNAPGSVEEVEENIIEHTVADTSDEKNSDDNAIASDEMKEIFADDSIPTISFGTNEKTTPENTKGSNDSESSTSDSEDTEVLGYENEGLSDVYEDPDVLEDQDKLDF